MHQILVLAFRPGDGICGRQLNICVRRFRTLSDSVNSFHYGAPHTRTHASLPWFIGLMPSLLCGFGPLLLNMAVFALIYPFVSRSSFLATNLPSSPAVLVVSARHPSSSSASSSSTLFRRRYNITASQPLHQRTSAFTLLLASEFTDRHTDHD